MKKPAEPWSNRLHGFMLKALGREKTDYLWQKYRDLPTPGYQHLISPRYALNDILHIERLLATGKQQISLLKPYHNQPGYRIHFYNLEARYLDEFIPILENLNLRVIDQVQFSFPLGQATATIKSFTVAPAGKEFLPLRRLQTNLLEAIGSIIAGRVENDALNKLVVLAGLAWQEIEVLRTYRNYYLQIDHKTSLTSLHHAFLSNPAVALGLYRFFEHRFRPAPEWEDILVREEQALFPLRLQLLKDLDEVADINDDRILRTVFNLIDATVRSNFHIRRSREDFFVAIKINSLGVLEMPLPRPMFEIYVHAADMEGIHLRAGKISRGGIRWSDRVDDFRAEILDLMQTQVNKNALIIPTGAKGGFIIKKRNGEAAKELGKKGELAYSRFIRGLLDLSDNYHDEAVASPEGIVTYDDPDPYLVVAADKGTARFSDIANGIAAEYGFWLADAFASGGSHGYDHKDLGITARGAWLCVQRHFRELGKDIQAEPFSVVGIGSMDGDVFGNGMLLSPCIRLLAAFSGQHIFIDPDPTDLELAYKERKRLFELAGSTWIDYDRRLISAGGGVFPRAAKDIPVSLEMKKWLGIRYNAIDGDSLIRLLLQAPVELLWLGGIGTYVKSEQEKHEEVGDKNNDNVRVDASRLKAKVVGEGANLGFTQKARIEYSLLGGKINTDAVDNSAGVDTSDHEVNLKILLGLLQKKGLIADTQSLFEEMTEAICGLVLADNIQQSLCLSLEQRRCAQDVTPFLQVADRLEAAGFLDREVEAFGQNKDIKARAGQIITRPELAVLMAAGKRYLTHLLQEQPGLLADACYDRYLQAYFPARFGAQFKAHLAGHPLADAIKTTVISNKIINQAGVGFLNFNGNNSGHLFLSRIDCYLAYDLILKADDLRQNINALPVTAERQYELLLLLEHTLNDYSAWSSKRGLKLRPDAVTVETYRHYLAEYDAYLQAPSTEQQADAQGDIPSGLRQRLTLIGNSQDFPFIVSLALETGRKVGEILAQLADINRTLGLDDIRSGLAQVTVRDIWEKKIMAGLNEDIEQITGLLLKKMLGRQLVECDDYFALQTAHFERYLAVRKEVMNAMSGSLTPYIVFGRALNELAEAMP